LWVPIARALPPQVQRVWLCPDADAAIIPWSIFSDKIAICTVDSPREFISIKETRPAPLETAANLLLAAGITYSDRSLALPGSRQEFVSINETADRAGIAVVPMTGLSVTEQAIAAALPGSTYAHFATHGFYSGSRAGAGRGVASAGARALISSRQALGESAYLIDARNPLMSSGLLLSGGSLGSDTAGEGKLTADDLVGLDLQKCRLVTLSACETGLGKKMSGQGVIGLRSAILGAGASCMLMSLWKVDDAATSELMKQFYSQLWGNHQTAVEALRIAQESVRQTPGWQHPYYWAAWVLAGDGWR
jgi:CHAT domain-containing protein